MCRLFLSPIEGRIVNLPGTIQVGAYEEEDEKQ
jgi:hypothetical protein